MTTILPPDSHRRVHAMKLGRHLTAILAARKISKRGLADTLSTSRSLLILWCKGDVLPSLDQARELSEALSDQTILEIVKAGRMLTCPVCARTFEWRGGVRATYCSDRCRKYGANGASRQRANLPLVQAELAIVKGAVAAFCGACEPDGICKTPACQLRDASPLPLRSAIEVDAAQPWKQGPLSPVGLAAVRLAAQRRWSKPGERQRMGALIRAHHPANDPERRAAWREAVSAGRGE
jgi:hypothetical protein